MVTVKTSAYLWIEHGIEPVHVHIFTNELKEKRHIFNICSITGF